MQSLLLPRLRRLRAHRVKRSATALPAFKQKQRVKCNRTFHRGFAASAPIALSAAPPRSPRLNKKAKRLYKNATRLNRKQRV